MDQEDIKEPKPTEGEEQIKIKGEVKEGPEKKTEKEEAEPERKESQKKEEKKSTEEKPKEEKPKEKAKPEAPRTSTCTKCGKNLSRKSWYYRNGKYYCNKKCWKASKIKT